MSSLGYLVFHAINLDHLALAGWLLLGASVELCFGQFFAVEKPLLAAISPINRWTIFAVWIVVEIPTLGAISTLNCWTIFAVQFVVEIPMLGAINPLTCRTVFTMPLAVEIPPLAAGIANLYCVSFHS